MATPAGHALIPRVAGTAFAIALVATSPAQALDQDDADSFIRFGDASTEAFRKFGDSALGTIKRSEYREDFKGIGNKYQDYQAMRRAERVMETGRNAVRGAKGSLSYAVLPSAFLIADEGMEFAGAAAGGDMPTAVGTAVSVAAEMKAVAGTAALFGAWGAAAGSFLPVVGTTIGGVIGGAVGVAAGGFTASYAYDKYLKKMVVNGVAGMAGVFDETPLHKAMMARDELLREQAAGDLRAEWEKLRMVSADFNPEGAELIGPGTTPYIVVPKAPSPPTSASTPAPEQQSALTTGNVLAGVRKFSIGTLEWEINGDVATHRHVYPGGATSVVTARGTVSPNRIEGTMVWNFPGDPCHIRQSEHFVYVFDAENVVGHNDPGPVEVRAGCKGWDKMTRGMNFTAPWKKLQ
ncbi:MAG: hypothetical protein JO245_07195 [Pseudolabrys sp.]|nr:hypothetical protein [Pseudolabrys sp.]